VKKKKIINVLEEHPYVGPAWSTHPDKVE